MSTRDRINHVIDNRPDLTMRNVSLKAGMSDSALHKYLTNPEHSMSVANLERVAEVLGVSLRWLLFGDEPGEGAEIMQMWEQIPNDSRAHAKDVLATFVKSKGGNA